MTVNVDVSRCENSDELWADGPDGLDLAPVTKWLGIIICLHVGMDEITMASEQEVYARLVILQGLYGGSFMQAVDPTTGEATDRPFTMADVRRHRGMRVNTRREAPATFMARVRRVALDRAQEEARDLDRAPMAEATN